MNGNSLLSWEKCKELACENHIVVAPSYSFGKSIKDNLADHFPKHEYVFRRYCDALINVEPGIKAFWDTEVFNPTNMFIARRRVIESYCEWFFRLIIPLAWDFQEYEQFASPETTYQRMLGFMGERLLTYWIQKNGLKAKEWPVKMIKGGILC